MVNGVLRNFLRTPRREISEIQNPMDQIAIETSHPTWMVKRWAAQYGEEKARWICRENNVPPQVSIRVNSLKITREELKERFLAEGYVVEESQVSPLGLLIISGGNVSQTALYREGYFTIQDESSMLITPLLDPQPGMRVLDVCAAPGGKTTHIAEYMQDQGEVVANDLHPHKEQLIKEQSKRLGVHSIHTKVCDARKLREQMNDEFDRILLDAPCSGFGVIRRKPDIKWKKKKEDVTAIAQVQYELLKEVAPLLKKGGSLVYSTCTIDQEENEQLVRRFIEDFPEFTLVEEDMRQILPIDFGSDGFFMAKIIRSEK